MPVSILMPALSPTMTEGTLAKWVKKEGDTIEAGDVIAEIETDKATMEVEAVDEGTLAKILIDEGTQGVAVNKMIAVLLEEGESDSELEAFLKDGTKAQDNAKPVSKEMQQPKTEEKTQPKPASAPAPNNSNRVFASPLAKRLAKDAGIDIASVKGSGPKGRVVKADIENAKKNGTAQNAATAQGSARSKPASSGPDARQLADMLGMEYEAFANNNMRKTIASRLLESKQTVPHFYLSVECHLDNLLAIRKQMNEAAEGAYKLSVNDFMIKASAAALKKIPDANAAWTESHIIKFKHADVSVAVATDNGLITPIIKQAENLSLSEISEQMKDLAARARDGKLKPTEYQGGTFSLSNLGMYGISQFSAIINPPQACILAIGAGEQKPVVKKDGTLGIGTLMTATLSCDHRVVDGAVGAEFLQAFKGFIENPLKMLA